ncbi:MAG: YqcI/YcgG family protein [Candidatus Eremiobacteraeota bacterium]|nr:YqcI/YcgG family protein [Candidatus Eremiobacteraeota bacterium]
MGNLKPRQALALYTQRNPFETVDALRCSNYSAYIGDALVRLLDWREPSAQARLADRALREFISSDRFSCVAGKAAIASGGYRFGYYHGFSSTACAEGIARDLAAFVAERSSMRATYATFVAVFEEPHCGDEAWFETALWRQLQRLAELNGAHYRWDAAVSSDPASPNFAFSFAGRAFFVVGMHANSSRISRRFFLPAIAFNLHSQFAAARRSGRFQKIQQLVRARETALQGEINPELREFGADSEARQYSGRQTEQQWRCPFRAPS